MPLVVATAVTSTTSVADLHGLVVPRCSLRKPQGKPWENVELFYDSVRLVNIISMSLYDLWLLYPRSSMYGIFTYIDPINDPNVCKYTIHGSFGYLYTAPLAPTGAPALPSLHWQRALARSQPTRPLVHGCAGELRFDMGWNQPIRDIMRITSPTHPNTV